MGYAGDVYGGELKEVIVNNCDPDSEWYDFCRCNPEWCDCTNPLSPNYPCEYVDNGDCTDYRSSAFPCFNPCDSGSDDYDACLCDPASCDGDTPTEPIEPGCSVTCDSGYIVNEELCECVLNPCDKNQQTFVKNQINDPYLANKLSNVKASLQPPNTSIESGFGIYKISTGNNVATPIVTGTSTNLTVTIGFGTSDPNYTPSAVLHTHPSSGYANPSAGDIYGLASLYTSINTVTTSYIVAADGTTYAMVVTDPTELAEFLTAYPASTNQLNDSFNPGSPMQKLYKDAYDSFTNSGLSDATAEERANAVVMAEAGINLLKAPANSTDFKQIQGTQIIDSYGNSTFTKSDCP
jgi:hypothetical protein